MLIPFSQLAPDTLRAVVEEFVTRDGTELTDTDVKVQQVLRQLEAGRAELHYDEQAQTTSIVFKDR
jgi:hypothetical protein